MALKRLVGPTTEPVTVAEAKTHCRVSISEDDDLIELYIQAAREWLESWLGRILHAQTWELALDQFPSGDNVDGIRLPFPITAVTSIVYLDADGAEQTLDAEDYEVDADSEPGWVVPGQSGWPVTGEFVNAVRIRFTCGYGEGNVPAPLKIVLLMLVEHMYDNRAPVVVGTIAAELPVLGIDRICWPYRIYTP